MADAAGFWQRLPSQGKICFLVLLGHIVFLIISMGLTAWSVSDYDTFIKFFDQYNVIGGVGSGSGNPFATLGSGTSFVLPTNSLSFGTTSTEESRSSTLEIDQISRSYSTFTSTFTTTATSFSVDPAGYTATSYTTWTRPNGNPYMTFTYYLGGTRSAVTTVTSTGTRLARTTLAKRGYEEAATKTAESGSSESTATAVSPTAAESEDLRQGSPVQSMPTAAPTIPSSPAAAIPDSHRMVVQQPDPLLSAWQTRKLSRRQLSPTAARLQQYLDAAKVLLALNAVILALIILQLILSVAYLVFFLTSRKHDSDAQADGNPHQNKFGTYTKWFVIIASTLCFLLLVFAIASTAYNRTKFQGAGAGNIALFTFFWIVTALLGFVLAADAHQLHSSKNQDSSTEGAVASKTESTSAAETNKES